MSFWCHTLVTPAGVQTGVRIVVHADGRIRSVQTGTTAQPGDDRLGTVLPGMANAHSHAFHRALRGRTHDGTAAGGGDFWQWRDLMYRVANTLDPDLYVELARAVFAEMLVSGWTAVGEFHYLHHDRDGTPYTPAHAMELALAQAAASVGIRLVLLDTLYLTGGIDQPLSPAQARFSDGTVQRWLGRWHALRTELAGHDRVSLGVALHSVRAVPVDAMRTVLTEIPADVPVHVHLSEQPQENSDSLRHYGTTPAGLLESIDGLRPQVGVVHATHLTDADIARIGAARASAVFCPSTEADLGDGIGPALELSRAGSPIALGSDQNAVIDPFLEMRGLEAGERLRSGRRGRFSPAELLAAATANGYAALGLGAHGLRPGDPCDLVEVAPDTVRTVGSLPAQLLLTATAADVRRVIVAGRVVAQNGRLADGTDPAALLGRALTRVQQRLEEDRA